MDFKFLGTFCHPDKISTTQQSILNSYKDVNKIFVLNINLDELLLTYNTSEYTYKNNNLQTIILNRKKQYNTIYTINAINSICKESNIKDIHWPDYKEQILLVRNNKSYISDIQLIEIIHVKTI